MRDLLQIKAQYPLRQWHWALAFVYGRSSVNPVARQQAEIVRLRRGRAGRHTAVALQFRSFFVSWLWSERSVGGVAAAIHGFGAYNEVIALLPGLERRRRLSIEDLLCDRHGAGINDDLNKAVWAALNLEPGLSVEEVVGQYARLHFGAERGGDDASPAGARTIGAGP